MKNVTELINDKWRYYYQELTAVGRLIMESEWSYFVTIRRGAGDSYKSFTGQGDDGYKKREDYTRRFICKLRRGLRINNKRHLQYLVVNEFGENGFGHVHLVIHFNKEVSEFAVESALRELAETERKDGYLIYYKPPEKYEMKHHADIKIRSKEDVCEYMTKVEKVPKCCYPLSKQYWTSKFLV